MVTANKLVSNCEQKYWYWQCNLTTQMNTIQLQITDYTRILMIRQVSTAK